MGRGTRFFQYFVDHWRGKNRLSTTICVSLIAFSIGYAILVGWLATSGTIAIWLVCCLGAVLLAWQTTGTLRAAETHLRSHSDALPAWGGYGALLVAAVTVISSAVTSIIGAYTPPPYIPPAAAGVAIQSDTLFISGDITLLVNTTAKRLLDAHPEANIVSLDSSGGSVHAARGLARTIIERGMGTVAEGPCNSACTLVFMAGETRALGLDGALGFHKYKVDLPNYAGGKSTAQEQERDARYFAARGVAPWFIEKIFLASHDHIWVPDQTELRSAGVLTSTEGGTSTR